jgi:hypothetical protein
MKKPKNPRQPIFCSLLPCGEIGGLLVMVDARGDAFVKQLDFSLSPVRTQFVAWTYIGNPWKDKVEFDQPELPL